LAKETNVDSYNSKAFDCTCRAGTALPWR